MQGVQPSQSPRSHKAVRASPGGIWSSQQKGSKESREGGGCVLMLSVSEMTACANDYGCGFLYVPTVEMCSCIPSVPGWEPGVCVHMCMCARATCPL